MFYANLNELSSSEVYQVFFFFLGLINTRLLRIECTVQLIVCLISFPSYKIRKVQDGNQKFTDDKAKAPMICIFLEKSHSEESNLLLIVNFCPRFNHQVDSLDEFFNILFIWIAQIY